MGPAAVAIDSHGRSLYDGEQRAACDRLPELMRQLDQSQPSPVSTCAQTLLALGQLPEALVLGVRVPERLAVIGFGDIYLRATCILHVSLLPDSEFITKGGAHLKASAALSVTGDAMVPRAAIAVGAATAKIGGDVQASVSGGAHINISMSVMTTKLLTTGTGDYVGEWSIRRGEQPLLGEQSFLSTVLIPSGQRDLEVQLRAYVHT